MICTQQFTVKAQQPLLGEGVGGEYETLVGKLRDRSTTFRICKSDQQQKNTKQFEK